MTFSFITSFHAHLCHHTDILSANRIVRDYEKYIARQFKRGASRQELNVSWLKKNELDLRRHVSELRDSIRSNWTSTGSEVGKELRQFWQNSRPGSPAPGVAGNGGRVGVEGQKTANAGSAFEHLKHLEVPGQTAERGRPESIGGSIRGRNEDFVAGYSLGLIGGVRSWVSTTLSPPFCSPPLKPDEWLMPNGVDWISAKLTSYAPSR